MWILRWEIQTFATTKALWYGFSAIFWISDAISEEAKYQRRLIVTVSLPWTMQKLASKTTCLDPFWGSMARGDSRTTTPVIEIEPVEVVGEKEQEWMSCLRMLAVFFYDVSHSECQWRRYDVHDIVTILVFEHSYGFFFYIWKLI